jgi:hypothetical protein
MTYVRSKVSTDLYLAVLPLVHTDTGMTEQTLTLFPHRSFATEFFPDEVEDYIGFFEIKASKYLVGDHVLGYEFHRERTDDGRVIVRVTQNVR